MSTQRRTPAPLSRTSFLKRCLGVLATVALTTSFAQAQTSTTTTTTTSSSDGSTTVTTQETTTTGSSGTVVVRQAHPLGPAGVGGVARRTSRRTSRRHR